MGAAPEAVAGKDDEPKTLPESSVDGEGWRLEVPAREEEGEPVTLRADEAEGRELQEVRLELDSRAKISNFFP